MWVPALLYDRIFWVHFPFNRIVEYILSGSFQFLFVTNHVLIIVALPKTPSKSPPFIHLHAFYILNRCD